MSHVADCYNCQKGFYCDKMICLKDTYNNYNITIIYTITGKTHDGFCSDVDEDDLEDLDVTTTALNCKLPKIFTKNDLMFLDDVEINVDNENIRYLFNKPSKGCKFNSSGICPAYTNYDISKVVITKINKDIDGELF